MSSKTFNVAVIGYGLSAKIFNIPFILAVPALKLYGVVQRHPKPDDDAAKDHLGIKTWRSSEEMVKDPDVDVVVVTSIPTSHFELTKLALEAGKHVVVEKPFVPTHKEAGELIRIARDKGRLLTVYQNRRFDADFLTVKHLLKNDTLGRIVEFETHFDRHSPKVSTRAPWKNEDLPAGGQIYDLGTHLIDQVVTLFGLPQRITTFIGNQRQGVTGGPGDSFTVLLHYSDGVMATAKAGVISPEVEQLRYWIRGEKGSFKKFHMDSQEEQLAAGKRPGDQGYGIEEESHHGTLTVIEDGKPVRNPFPTIEPATYVEFYRLLAKALAGEGEVPVRPEDASAVIRLIELAKESSKEGKTLEFAFSGTAIIMLFITVWYLFSVYEKLIPVLVSPTINYTLKRAYATFFSTRIQDDHEDDPYFTATRTLAYQLLHHPETRTRQNIPFLVLVPPHVAERKRRTLAAEGATIVRVENMAPTTKWSRPAEERWVDMFTKLRLFNLTEYDRVLCMDGDMLLTQSLDGIWDEPVALEVQQTLNKTEEVMADEAPLPPTYLLAGISDSLSANHSFPPPLHEGLNGGFFLLRPDPQLLAHYQSVMNIPHRFDSGAMEQNLLRYAHRWAGNMPWRPFPAGRWNVNWPTLRDFEGGAASLHEKFWDKKDKDRIDRKLVEMWYRVQGQMEGYWQQAEWMDER